MTRKTSPESRQGKILRHNKINCVFVSMKEAKDDQQVFHGLTNRKK
jgi:hypothetical protein